jgi:hypothetical protein
VRCGDVDGRIDLYAKGKAVDDDLAHLVAACATQLEGSATPPAMTPTPARLGWS